LNRDPPDNPWQGARLGYHDQVTPDGYWQHRLAVQRLDLDLLERPPLARTFRLNSSASPSKSSRYYETGHMTAVPLPIWIFRSPGAHIAPAALNESFHLPLVQGRIVIDRETLGPEPGNDVCQAPEDVQERREYGVLAAGVVAVEDGDLAREGGLRAKAIGRFSRLANRRPAFRGVPAVAALAVSRASPLFPVGTLGSMAPEVSGLSGFQRTSEAGCPGGSCAALVRWPSVEADDAKASDRNLERAGGGDRPCGIPGGAGERGGGAVRRIRSQGE
jgi:hypothetical protein